MKRNQAKRSRLARLQVESLEPRQLMAVLTATLDASSRTLTILGTDQADIVAVTQNDGANQLTVSLGENDATTRQFTASLVQNVVVRLGAGDDSLTWRTVGDVWNAKDMRLDLGVGDDTAKLLWAEDGGVSRTNLTVSVSGGDGSDAFAAHLGRARAQTRMSVRADMGAGDDAFAVQSLNPDSPLESRTIVANGGDGSDSLEYYASGAIARSANVAVRLDGQAGDDALTFENNGRVDGELVETLHGGDGNDSFSSVVGDGSGRGRYALQVDGGVGDDQMTIDVRTPRARSFASQIALDGGAGNDVADVPTSTTPANTEVVNAITNRTRPYLLESFDPVLPTRTLKSGTRTIDYWTTGKSRPDDPVVVLLAGAGASIDSWASIVPGLQGVAQVISVNKPGYGRTDLPASESYARTVVEDVRAVVARIASGRQVVLVGHSVGGPYASLYARLYPNEVAGVVFEDSTQQVRVADEDLNSFAITGPQARIYPAGTVAEYAALGASINAPLDAAAFPKVPVIGVFENIPEFLPYAQAYADLGYPGSLQMVSDAGHFIHLDKPQVIVDAIKEMIRKTQISGILADAVAKYGVPGLSASVVIGDRILTGAAGVRSADSTAAVQANDRFGVGSVTKAMTATLVGILVERGALRWNTTIAELFPELRDAMQPVYRNITIEQLLQHRGRIVADEDASEGLIEKILAYNGTAANSRLTLLPEILKEPAPGVAGEFRYSNAGYSIAGAMLERATGISYERLMQRYIFNPLGMRSATFDRPAEADPSNPKQPVGHGPDGKPTPGDRSPAAYLGVVSRPAGADLRMNAADWAKFVRVHLGRPTESAKFVTPATLVRLHASVPVEGTPSGYALGWVTAPSKAFGLDPRYGQILVHAGSDGAWLSEVNASDEVDFSIQILANGTVDKDGNDLGLTAFEEIRTRLFQRFAPKFSTASTTLENQRVTNTDMLYQAAIVDAVFAGQAERRRGSR